MPKINLVQEVRGLFESSVKGTVRQTASALIPYYNFFEDHVVSFLNRQKGVKLGSREDRTVVDKNEIKSTYSNINSELGASLNPFKIAFNLLRRLFGNTRQNRIQTELNLLDHYSGLYDNFLFANDTLEFLKTKIEKEISKKEGLSSKLGLKLNKKILNDPVINQLKSTFKSWLEPFEQILSGGVEGVTLYKQDIEFLQNFKISLETGGHAKYLNDLAQDVNRILQKIIKQQQRQYRQPQNQQQPTVQRAPNFSSRQKAQQLASLAA